MLVPAGAASATTCVATARTLVMMCSAVQPRGPEPLGRRALLLQTALAVPALALPNLASASEVIAAGQLQYNVKLPPGATATITARVVGRNSKGPLATLVVQDLSASPSPVEFVITREDLREVPDFVWLDEDLYLKADVEYQGKTLLVGRGKAKAVAGDGSIDTKHTKAALELS